MAACHMPLLIRLGPGDFLYLGSWLRPSVGSVKWRGLDQARDRAWRQLLRVLAWVWACTVFRLRLVLNLPCPCVLSGRSRVKLNNGINRLGVAVRCCWWWRTLWRLGKGVRIGVSGATSQRHLTDNPLPNAPQVSFVNLRKRPRAGTPDCGTLLFSQVHCQYAETICRLQTIVFDRWKTFK